MNLKAPGAILPLGWAFLSTRANTVGGLLQPPLGELGLMITIIYLLTYLNNFDTPFLTLSLNLVFNVY